MKAVPVVFAALVLAASGSAGTTAYEPIYPMVSPDGTHIAWFEGSTWQLETAYPDGTNVHRAAAFAANGAGAAAWTQEGFVVSSNFTLFLVAPSGKRVRLGPDAGFSFSVGGNRAATGSGGQPGQVGRVRVVDLRSRHAWSLGSPKVANVDPGLSPDGTRVAWTASGRLWVARVGGSPHRLVAHGSCPQWSPSGKWIAYLSPPDDDLRMIPAAGGRPRTLLARAGGCDIPGGPAWSPDSTRIATAAHELTVLDVTTRHAVHVAKALGRVAGGFAWTPDGRALYASVRPWVDERAHDNCTSLWRLDAATLKGTVVVRGCP